MRPEAFAVMHHVWANERLAEFVGELAPEAAQLRLEGTYGSVQATLGHLVIADSMCLQLLCGGERSEADIQERLRRSAVQWMKFLEEDFDPEAHVTVHRRVQPPQELEVPAGIILAQALSHAADHRAQIAVTLSSHEIEPPNVDALAFALSRGAGSGH